VVVLEVRKFGNSLGVVLPKEVINRLKPATVKLSYSSSNMEIWPVYRDGEWSRPDGTDSNETVAERIPAPRFL
jgi:antitoxin component of MazEF toxin-antitoxin module